MQPAPPPPLSAELASLLSDLRGRLTAASAPDCIAHRAVVLRGVATRGAKIPAVRAAVSDWARERARPPLPSADMRRLAEELILRSEYVDDVVAGVLYVAEALVVRGVFGAADMEVYKRWFAEGGLDNYLAVDNFADKVLTRLIAGDGMAVVAALEGWWAEDGAGLWTARAALLSLAPSAKDVAARGAIERGCRALVQRPEEEAKAVTGTLLRAVSKPTEAGVDADGIDFVEAFVGEDDVLVLFSRSALTKALHHFGAARKAEIRQRCTLLKACAGAGAAYVEPDPGPGGAPPEG